VVLRRETKRTDAATQQRTAWRAPQAEVAEALALAQACATLVRQRQPTPRAPWLQRATTRAVEAVRRLATGLAED
jgi:hypothetical protein